MTPGLLFERIRDKEEDREDLFNLKSEPNDIYWSGYTSAPDRSAFKDWFGGQLQREDRTIWLVKTPDARTIGYLYLTCSSEDTNRIGYISHGVTEKEKGKGIGSSIVRFVVDGFTNNILPADQLQAWIVKENLSSVKTFLKNGFVRSSLEKTQFYASMNREVVLENYFLKRT
ncbi:MAG TPA: GNAT family N-acetyltransferase [Puia sp.]|nr:GNAT family N-acetyltransferase [Puia sp.]